MSESGTSSSPVPVPVARWSAVGAVAVVVLLADQFSKGWAMTSLGDGRVQPVFWTMQLRLARNTGAAFSFGRDNGAAKFLPLLVLVVVAAVVWRSRSVLTRSGAVAIGLIIGGAVGNLVDRASRTDGGPFFSGGVVDFIDFQWWPVFNVADMGVVVGGILFALVALLQEERRSPAEVADAPVTTDPGHDAPSS